MYEIGVVNELDLCLRFKRLQSFKLEFLVVLLDNRVLDKVNDMVTPPDLPRSIVIHRFWLQFVAMCGQLFHEVLRRVVKSDEHDEKVTLHDPEVKAEAELLLGSQLGYALHMFKLKRQAFLLLQRVLLLLFSPKGFVLLAVNVHAFQHIAALLHAHFHVYVLKWVR